MTDMRQLDHKTSLVAVCYKGVTEWYKIPSFRPEISHRKEHTNSTKVRCGYCNRSEKVTQHICLGSDAGKVSLSYALQDSL